MYEETDQYNFGEQDPAWGDEMPGYDPMPPQEEEPPSNIISTSQAINLTGTLASISTLFAIFLLFADQRSRAVRRFSVQSAGLGVAHIAVGMLCWIVSALLGWIPLVGYLFTIVFIILFIALTVLIVVLRVRMMYHAYRGLAYVLPVIGETLRRYE